MSHNKHIAIRHTNLHHDFWPMLWNTPAPLVGENETWRPPQRMHAHRRVTAAVSPFQTESFCRAGRDKSRQSCNPRQSCGTWGSQM